MSTPSPENHGRVHQTSAHPAYAEIHESAEFQELRTRFRSFVFPATVAFIAWYLLYVIMSNWAHDFMSIEVVGNINVAVIFGLLQFATTFLIAWLYGRYMRSRVDPLARELEQRYNDATGRGDRPMSTESLSTVLFLAVVARDDRHHLLGQPADQHGRRLLLRRTLLLAVPERAGHLRRLHVGRLVPRHLRSHRAVRATTASSTRSGSSSPGWSRCCWSPRLLRNSGRYTMADQLAYRMRQRPVRTAAATSTVVVSIFYLLAQMVGAGALVTLLLGVDGEWAIRGTIVIVGLLMIFYVVVGGMKGTTWVQIVKAVLLMTGTVLITVLVLAQFNFNLSELLGAAAQNTGKGEAFLQPGLAVRRDADHQIDFVSLALALVLGTAGLPHILIRFYTVPDGPGRADVGQLGDHAHRRLLPDVAGARLRRRGPARHGEGDPVVDSAGNLASPLLAEEVGGGAGTAGGAILLAFIAAVAFATILAVVAGLTLDLGVVGGARHLRERHQEGPGRTEKDEVRVARIAAFVIGGVAIVLSIFAAVAQHRLPGGAGLRGGGVGEPAVAALQPVLEAVQHPRRDVGDLRRPDHLRRPGVLLARWCPGSRDRDVPASRDWSWFPLANPGIISIPLGFLLGWLGHASPRNEPAAEEAYTELEVRSLTGAGSEKAVQH